MVEILLSKKMRLQKRAEVNNRETTKEIYKQAFLRSSLLKHHQSSPKETPT